MSYLDAGNGQRDTGIRYVVGTVVAVVLWLGVGSVLSVWLAGQLGVSVGSITEGAPVEEQVAGLAVIIAPFFVLLTGIVGIVRVLHRRPPITLLTDRTYLDTRRVLTGFGIWFGLSAIAGIIGYLIAPTAYRVSPDPSAVVPFALAAAWLIVLQTTTEEVFFRGYLVQAWALLTRNALVLAIASGFLFTLPHLMNPGMDANAVWLAMSHFGFGAFLAWVSVRDGRLELALGAHAANNLFGALVLSYAGSALRAPSLLLTDRLVPAFSLLQLGVSATVFALLVFGWRRNHRA